MRDPKHTDFDVKVPGVGSFVFARRTLLLEIACNVAYARLTEGVSVDPYTDSYCGAVADLSTLMVDGPPKWGPDEIGEMDGYDPKTYENIQKVWGALRDKEEAFRPAKPPQEAPPRGADGEGAGEGDGGLLRAVVPPAVQPHAE